MWRDDRSCASAEVVAAECTSRHPHCSGCHTVTGAVKYRGSTRYGAVVRSPSDETQLVAPLLSWWVIPARPVSSRSRVRQCALAVTPDASGSEARTLHAVAAWAMVVAMHTDAATIDLIVTNEKHGLSSDQARAGWTARIDGRRPADDVLRQILRHPTLPPNPVCIEAHPRRDAESWDCGLSIRLAPRLSGHTLAATIVCDPPGLDEGYLAVLGDHFERAFARVRGSADDTPACRLLLSERDWGAYEKLNATTGSPHGRRIDDAVGQVASDHPDRVAIVDGNGEYSYQALLAEAMRIEGALLSHGCLIGDHVLVMLPRSMKFIATKLAILRLGAVYVPCEPRWPRAQVQKMLETLSPAFVVSGNRSKLRISPRRGSRRLPRPESGSRRAEDAACVIFTSGSTGAPKGVVLPHRAFTRLFDVDGLRLFTSSTVCLGAAPVQWDAWALETWGTLIAGGRLVIHRDAHPTPETIRSAVKRGVNTAWITAALLNVLVDEDISCLGGLELLMSGGERLSPRHIARIQTCYPELRVVNGYGTVEVGLFASLGVCDPVVAAAGSDLSIGTPVEETAVFVVERHPDGPRLCPVDVLGELAVMGPGLSLGYLHGPAETKSSFVSLRVSANGSARAYLTGDLGILGHDGQLHYRGRRDRQLKVRGVRVEPGAIEDFLQSHCDVARAAVLPLRDREGHVDGLAAYVVPRRRQASLDTHALRAWLAERLPPQVVPRHIEQVPDLPRTETGKLAEPDLARRLPRHSGSTAVGAPGVGELAAMMAEILSVLVVNETDSFFELGGDSLLATRLAARLGAVSGRHVSVADIMRAPTPQELSPVLQGATHYEYARPVTPPNDGDPVPISPGQGRHLVAFLTDRLGTGSIVQCVHTINGPLDSAALARAWEAVISAHEAFRTVIDIRSSPPTQTVLPADDFALRQEIADGPWDDSPREAARVAAEELRALDITSEPLTHGRLITSGKDAVLVVTQHHVVTDGWSERIMLNHLSRAYEGALRGASDAELAPQVPGYRVYTQWYANTMRRVGPELRAYWANHLANLPSLPPLASGPDGPPRELRWRLNAEATTQWRRSAAAHRVSLLSLLVDRYASSLRDVTETEEFAVALLVSGRWHEAFDETAGFFVNTIPVRMRPGRADERLGEHHEALMSAVGHSLLPFDEIVAAARPKRSARHPLAQAMMTMQPGPPPVLALRDCAVTRVHVPSVEDPLELTLEAYADGRTLTGGLYCPATAEGDLLDQVRERMFTRPP
jgi:mycobactin peptide synthetase MbtE